jgi:hypothetical protein
LAANRAGLGITVKKIKEGAGPTTVGKTFTREDFYQEPVAQPLSCG